MVEVARLESVYRFIAYRGFESPSLRQEYNGKKPPSGGFFLPGRLPPAFWQAYAGPQSQYAGLGDFYGNLGVIGEAVRACRPTLGMP